MTTSQSSAPPCTTSPPSCGSVVVALQAAYTSITDFHSVRRVCEISAAHDQIGMRTSSSVCRQSISNLAVFRTFRCVMSVISYSRRPQSSCGSTVTGSSSCDSVPPNKETNFTPTGADWAKSPIEEPAEQREGDQKEKKKRGGAATCLLPVALRKLRWPSKTEKKKKKTSTWES